MDMTGLTRKHGIKIPPTFPVSVEECCLAVGELVGYSSVKSAARMNNAVVIFLDTIENAEMVLDNGVEVGENFFPVYALSTAAVKVTVSNVPPFIRDEDIIRELSKHGRIVSKVRKVSSGSRSPLLQHVVSHRRQLHLVPNNRSKGLNLVFSVRVDDFDYIIYATTDDFKCFRCGKVGHQSRTCPGKSSSHKDQNQNQNQTDTEEGGGGKQDGQDGPDGVEKRREEGTSGLQGVRVEETSGAREGGVEETSGAREGRVEEASGAREGRVEETSGAREVRAEETSGAREVRAEETSGAQEVREEGTSGVQKAREEGGSRGQGGSKDGASKVQQVREGTGGQVETGREVSMEADEEQLTAPRLKRKQRGDSRSSHAKKVATKESGGAAECESSGEEDSESSQEEDSESSQEEGAAAGREPSKHGDGSGRSSGGYSVEKIKQFLKRSKNVRGARVEDYLSDKEKLSSSARSHMRSKDRGGLTKQEGYRLKKIVHQVSKELDKDGAQ